MVCKPSVVLTVVPVIISICTNLTFAIILDEFGIPSGLTNYPQRTCRSNKIWRTTHDDGPESRSLNPIRLRAFPFGPGCSVLRIRSIRLTRTASHPADHSNANKGMENGLKLRRKASGRGHRCGSWL